ncbi:MAG: hypothetical protein AAGF75_03675 [Cyanobacteria bacterium P01_H01_bin.130]
MANPRNFFLDPLILIPVMALTLGIAAAWRYWDNPDAFGSGPNPEDQGGFGDLLAELDGSQQDPEILAADIDSSDVLDDAFTNSSTESEDRISPGVSNPSDEEVQERRAKSAAEILKLLNNASKSPTGGGDGASIARLFANDSQGRSSSLSLGQFRADGSFQGRSLSLSPSEQELIDNAARAQGRGVAGNGQPLQVNPGNVSAGSAPAGAGLAGPGVFGVGNSQTFNRGPSRTNVPGYGNALRSPSTTSLPGSGNAPVGQTSAFTTPGFGTAPVPSTAGAGPLVPATSGPGYNRGLRNYQLNTAPPPSTGFGLNNGQSQPVRSATGAGALSQPQPSPSTSIGGRTFSSFSNPTRR